jgi:MFS family permease
VSKQKNMISFKDVWPFFLSLFILVLGNGLLSTLLGIRGSIEGLSEQSIGLVMSAYFFGFLLSSFFCPKLIARVGHIRTFAALASMASAIALLHAFSVSVFPWLLMRILTGVCYAGMIMVTESWLNARSGSASRGAVLALYSSTLLGGWGLSQFLLNLAPTDGFFLFCLVSILFSFSLVPIALSSEGTSGELLPSARTSLRRLIGISPMGISGALAAGVVSSSIWSVGSVYATQAGYGKSSVAFFIAAYTFGGFLTQWPAGKWSDRIDRRVVILIFSFLSLSFAFSLIQLGSQSEILLYTLSFMLGAVTIPIHSLCSAHVNDLVEYEEIVSVSSALVVVYGLGSMIGPLLASSSMKLVGPGGLFLFLSVTLLAHLVYALIRFMQRDAPPQEKKWPFLIMPRTTHAILSVIGKKQRRRP